MEKLAKRLDRILEYPMLALAIVWMVLLIIEFVYGLSPDMARMTTFIWGIFVVEYLVRFMIAPAKLAYVKQTWISLVALVLPAFRLFRLVSLARGLRIARVLTTINRGRVSLAKTFGRRQFGFVSVLTVAVVFIGAAGMYAFERGPTISSYSDSLWWTAMLMTTLGSDYWPASAEGRVLCVMLSVYSMGVFGYLAASLASHFIQVDANSTDSPVASEQSIAELHKEIRQLRQELRDGKPYVA